ncbi:MAG: carboxypeptidase-like regulatory domain-containing protein [Planctomycetota bacterium]
MHRFVTFARLLLGVALPFVILPSTFANERWTVEGRVLDPAGEPIEGARVACELGGGFSFPRLTAPLSWRILGRSPESFPTPEPFLSGYVETGPDGRFRIEDLPEPTLAVVGVYVESRPFLQEPFVTSSEHLESRTIDVGDLTMVEGGTISGQVQGEGAEGATIALQPVLEEVLPGETAPPRLPGHFRVVRADEAGTFQMEGLPSGRYHIAAFSEASRIDEDLLTVEPGVTTEVRFDLVRGLELSCTVVARSDRSPLEGVRLSLWPSPTGSSGTVLVLDSLVTDAEGRAVFRGLENQRYRIIAIPSDQVDAANLVPPFSVVRDVAEPGPVQIVISQGRDVFLSVRDPEGQPIDDIELARLTPIQSAPIQSEYIRRHGASGSFIFRDEGELLRAESVRPGVYRLTVLALGWVPAIVEIEINDSFDIPRQNVVDGSRREVSTEDADGLTRLVVELAPAVGILPGRVVDPSGDPIAGAEVQGLEVHRDLRVKILQEHVTDEDGRFTLTGLFDLGAHIKVEIDAPGFLHHSEVWTLLRDQTPPTIILTPASRLIGKLTNKEGQPIPYGRITLFDEQVEQFQNSEVARLLTDELGQFEVPKLAAGRYRLGAEHAEEVVVEIGTGEVKEVTIQRR